MTAELKKSVERLRTLSPKLNVATDDAQKVIALVENFLNNECSIGIPCEHRYSDGLEDWSYDAVAYDRHAGKFRIVIKKYRAENKARAHDLLNPGESFRPSMISDVTAWAEATRSDKLRSFAAIPSLLGKLVDEVDSTIESVTGASAAVHQLLEAIAPTDSPKLHPLTSAVINAGKTIQSIIAADATKTAALRRNA